jgi:HPr kinase/phosphorylase
MQLHATTIACAGSAVMLVGPSGSGKSQLALRLIRTGAWLVADDQTVLVCEGAAIRTSCPKAIKGRLEVRGIGIVRAPVMRSARLMLVIDLDPKVRAAFSDPRMPEIGHWRWSGAHPPGCSPKPIPCVPIDAFRVDAAEAVIAALAQYREWEDSPPP